GDHIVSDVRNAQARGMYALRTPRAVDSLRKDAGFRAIYPPSTSGGAGRSAMAGLTALRFFDRVTTQSPSTFRADPSFVGYAAIGPLYVGFALWLLRMTKHEGVRKLYFLSREGYLLKEI